MGGELVGKNAIVTGAARGIGGAIARRLGASGAFILIVDAEPASEAVEEIARAGGAACWIQSRIDGPASADAMLARIDAELASRHRLGTVDILVNNIGGGVYRTFEQTDVDLLDWTWALNVKVPFLVTRALLPRLTNGGRVINISSAGVRLADPNVIAYCMCKAALDTFTVSLAKELGPRRITVNSVRPGTTNNETNAAMLTQPEFVESIIADTLLGRVGQPSDVAELVHALVALAGDWVTGQNIEVSGGYKL